MQIKKIDTIANSSIDKLSLLYAAIILLIPFIVVFFYTAGLTKGMDTVFSIDEVRHHYPVILQFAKQLPFPDVSDYNSATTPLFHILFAAASKIAGTEITHLRMVNLLITYITVVLLFNILTDRFKISFKNALLFTLIFTLSPYYFREAFVVLTDNLPVLWLLIFFQFYLRYKENQQLRLFVWSMFFIMLLCLTRQTYLYVAAAVVADVLIGRSSVSNKIKCLLIVAICIFPTLLLFYIWKGLTPPSFIEVHTRSSLVNVKAITYGFSVLGFYALFIPGYNFYWPFFKKEKIRILAVIALACLLIYFFPLVKAKQDFGYLWYMSAPFPPIFGTSILFYLLTAIGAAIFLSIWQKEGMSFFLLCMIGLLLSEVPNKFIFQRYYDSGILILLLFLSAKYHVSNKIDYCRIAALVVFFIVYFVVYTIV